VTDVVIVLAVLTSALQAGTYYTWASGVMPGLARTDDRTFVHAMQQMNVAIVNPVFLASFLGAPVLGVLAAVLTDGDLWALTGAVGAVATLVITFGGNIPLNNALDAAGPVDDVPDLGAVRSAFESRWVRLNVLRALTSTAAVVLLTLAALRS